MLLNKQRYIYRPLADGLAKVAGGLPTSNYFIEATLSCAQNDGWAGPWEILAMANVIKVPIVSVYPPVNVL